MNYEVIKSPEFLEAFVNWLPDEQDNEMFYVCLFARSKYSPSVKLKSDKCQLKRFTSKKKHLIDKIRQLETPFGTYTQDGVTIPQEALALYITPNPRNLELAAKNLLIKLAQVVTQPYNGYNPHQLAMSEIQKACGKKRFVDFDFDNLDMFTTVEKAVEFLTPGGFEVLETRGGFHILVRPEVQTDKRWHPKMVELGCDVRGDTLLPVPGCTQGNFVPRFVQFETGK